jgi:hypothetical protein
MASRSAVTTVTTVTRKRHIPPLRVAQIVCIGDGTLSRNSARGNASESGYNGYDGYGEPAAARWRACTSGKKRRPRPICSGGCRETLRKETSLSPEERILGKFSRPGCERPAAKVATSPVTKTEGDHEQISRGAGGGDR